MIPAEAVEAARVAAFERYGTKPDTAYIRTLLNAASPHLLADVERELTDAKRMIALLILEAGGKVALSRRAIAEISDETVIETTQDVINGGWVIRAGSRQHGDD